MNAGYASLYYSDCCDYGEPTQHDLNIMRPYIENALKSDPSNEKALMLLKNLSNYVQGIDITLGAPFTPTVTPSVTITPLPSKTWTPKPTVSFTTTPSQIPTNTIIDNLKMTVTTTPDASQTSSKNTGIIIGVILVLGGVATPLMLVWLSRRRKS